jgi:hypothetical protein
MTLAAGLRRASTGLLIYGVVGLLVAVLGLVALVWVGGRVTTLSERTSAQVERLALTLDSSADALDDAATSAVSFALTLERTPPTIRQAAQTVANLQVNLRSVAGQLGAISILGSQPLGQVATLFSQMATDLEGLDTRLELIATDLEGNKTALLANAESLRATAVQLDTLATSLRAGFVEESFDDIAAVLTVLALALILVTALPAVGALVFGWWLRRTIDVMTARHEGVVSGLSSEDDAATALQAPTFDAEVDATLTLLATDSGGRADAVVTGYRPVLRLTDAPIGEQNIGMMEVVTPDPIEPGTSGPMTIRVHRVVAELVKSRLSTGSTADVLEGDRVVGRIVVRSVRDTTPGADPEP